MPVLGSSAYAQAEDVLNRVRVILNDFEIAGGDVITDTAPGTFVLLNMAFESVQQALATYGVETLSTEAWLLAVPAVTLGDPEARLFINDSGTQIIYPSGVGNFFSPTPQLPVDLVVPFKLWERQAGTTQFVGPPMARPNDGIRNMSQQQFLVDWDWLNDSLVFRGALQVQDVKVRYEKRLPQLAAVTDPIPVRQGANAAAYEAALIFHESRGGALIPALQKKADDELFKLQLLATRQRQRRRVRRNPYSGRGGRLGMYI